MKFRVYFMRDFDKSHLSLDKVTLLKIILHVIETSRQLLARFLSTKVTTLSHPTRYPSSGVIIHVNGLIIT